MKTVKAIYRLNDVNQFTDKIKTMDWVEKYWQYFLFYRPNLKLFIKN
jgi:hypothetical protein